MRSLPTPSDRPLGEGRHYWVDAENGAADNPGSLAEPWARIQDALPKLEPGDTLVLRGGIFHERLIVKISGEKGRPITLRAHPGEVAILDGGIAEFLEDPATAWEPVGAGRTGEFRSTRSHPGLGDAQGWFADSMVPLQAYQERADLLSTAENWSAHEDPRYCGPGLWFDIWSKRLHVRLAPTRLEALPPSERYQGETDPRKLPMIIGGGSSVPLWIEGSSYLRIQDLVVRGAGLSAIRLLGVSDLELDNVTAYSGRHALRMDRSDRVRIEGSAFRGTAAPWSFRSSHKYRGVPGVLFLTGGATRKNRDLEIAHSEFTDGHDGVFLGEVENLEFHHNLVHNFNDDGIFLTSRMTGPSGVEIYGNHIGRCLTVFAFGWGRDRSNRAGPGVYLYRNVIELLEPVHYFPPRSDQPQKIDFYGRVASDHGSPTWEPMAIYQNTFVARRPERTGYALGWGGHLLGTWRRLFNNIFVIVEELPTLAVREVDPDLETSHNLYWSADLGPTLSGDFFAAFRASTLFEASRRRHPPGWEASSQFADPHFVRFDRSGVGRNDYRLRGGSPAMNAGRDLPEGWPDPWREQDEGLPDIGALPAGSEPLLVGRPRGTGAGH